MKQNTPTIKFKYSESGTYVDVDKSTLLKVLSNGEKRALYILNLIFEIEALKKLNNDVVVVVDDIADSFDYRNKYAIIEYLNDILKSGIFKMIILTHNFDFYRTVVNRLGISRKNSFMVYKNNIEIKLIQGGYLKDIFSVWKNKVNNNDRIMIASIPFVRNLSEYLEEENSPNYMKLTSLLHKKDDTESVTVSELEDIYNAVWKVPKNLNGKDRKIIDILFSEAEKIVLDSTEKINLENKIVLSIAIRLLAEEFMISRISDKDKIQEIIKNQTYELIKLYKDEYRNIDEIKVLEQVNLMTPENIHMNSFMYEPILDLSDIYLKKLYEKVKEMSSISCEETAAGIAEI
ncbi:AAA family ATPase [Clostridium butyricum]